MEATITPLTDSGPAACVRAATNTVLVLATGAVLLFALTDGLNAFTSEGARRYHVEQHPVVLPRVRLTGTSGESFYIGNFVGKTVLVDFIFTHCAGICPSMTQRSRDIQRQLQQAHQLRGEVVLLTISFDPARDTPEVLKDHAAAVGTDAALWKFATVSDPRQLPALLNAFGIVVIPAKNGQFEHNGAIHRVDPDGRLAAIYDHAASEVLLQDLETAYGDSQK